MGNSKLILQSDKGTMYFTRYIDKIVYDRCDIYPNMKPQGEHDAITSIRKVKLV